MDYRVLHLGDRAVTFEFGTTISQDINRTILTLHAHLKTLIQQGDLAGILETVPTFRSLTVHYDPLVRYPSDIESMLAPYLTDQNTAASHARHWSLPVCYDPAYAPDLDDVSRTTGLSPQEVIAHHLADSYSVFMLGFLPGFAFMGSLAPALHVPRKKQPRTAVPERSVAIANEMTAVYPSESPGGWHLIGQTPLSLFSKTADDPFLLHAGDRVSFHQITTRDYDIIRRDVQANTYDPYRECLQKDAA